MDVISSTVFVPSVLHTPVKVDYSRKHTMCAGLNGKVLTEGTMGKRIGMLTWGWGAKKTPLK